VDAGSVVSMDSSTSDLLDFKRSDLAHGGKSMLDRHAAIYLLLGVIAISLGFMAFVFHGLLD
jgi:hypothetical protein